ncbi:MAG TPA: hypothetical protein PKC18_13945 [Lacipirellulaceae bacterium]|nr:hypothetical protein [Lacipirellulaceae bacterium]HMP07870.1 hypothetical protein [Lacipirellulaceae bacterium]
MQPEPRKCKIAVAEPLETIWEVEDSLWTIVEPIFDEAHPTKPTGQPRISFRHAFNVVLFRCQVPSSRHLAK